MKELIREIEARIKDAWTKKPADIDKMLERTGAKEQNLTISFYVQGDTNAAAYLLYMLYGLAKSQKGDIETLKKIAGNFLTFQGMRFKDYYHMEESHSLSLRAALAVKDVSAYEDFAELIRTVQRYFGQLAYWVDLSIPWSQLSQAHTSIMNELRPAL